MKFPKDKEYLSMCRVCGLKLDYLPWGEHGDHASYFICPCCGCEAGVDDRTIEGIRWKRQEWKKGDYKWFDEAEKPEIWDAAAQLANLPDEYI